MTPIIQALSSGYAEEEILEYLSKAAPSLSRSISKARSSGYSVSNILGFLSKTMQDDSYNPYLSQEAGHKKVAKNREKQTKQLLKTGISTAAIAGAVRGIPHVIQGIKGAFQGIKIPPSSLNLPSQMPNASASSQAPSSNTASTSNIPNMTPTPQAATAPNLSTQSASTTPQSPLPSPISNVSTGILKELGIEDQVKNLAKAGNNAEAIATAVNFSLKPHQKKYVEQKIKSGETQPLKDVIEQYLSQSNNIANPENANEKISPKAIRTEFPGGGYYEGTNWYGTGASKKYPEIKEGHLYPRSNENIETQKNLLISPQKWAEKMQKNDLVETPNGDIGELKEDRNGKSLVSLDGSLKQFPTKDLKALTEKYKDVHIDVSTVPENERSAPLYGIRTANANKNLIIEFFPENENVADTEYEYFRKDGKSFDDDLLNRLQEGLDIPVTSKVKWAGFWSADKADSRGSTNHHEIKIHAQEKEKVDSGKEKNDPNKPLWFIKKKSLFRHGYEREVRRKFGKHSKEFAKEIKNAK